MNLPPRLHTLLRKLECDRTVLFGLITRIWTVASGPITILLILQYFSKDVQGFHYTFASLLMVRFVAELGMSTIVQQFTAHEFARLQVHDSGALTGDPEALSRLASILRFAIRWFVQGSVVVTVLCAAGGYILFSRETSEVEWQAPWFALAVANGLLFAITPIWAVLEGCNQVRSVFLFRLLDSFVSRIAMWLVIILGGGLWAGVAPLIGTCAVVLCYLLVRQRKLLLQIWGTPIVQRIDWREEILPMQLRLGTSMLAVSLLMFAINPIAFACFGPTIAGQIGITINLLVAVGTVPYVWFHARSPKFGMLVAQEKHAALRELFHRLTGVYLVASAVLFSSLLLGVWALHRFELPYHDRFLALGPTTFFACATILDGISQIIGVFVRAHKEEPLTLALIIQASLVTIGMAVACHYGGVFAFAVTCFVGRLVFLPWILSIWRLYWKRHLEQHPLRTKELRNECRRPD